MHKNRIGLCLLAVILGVTGLIQGCANIEGKWSLARVEPTAARRDFAFESITLQDDGTFYAESRELGKTTSVSGTWSFDDGVLVLREHDGERHSYDADIESGGRTLTLVQLDPDGHRMTARFEKRTS